MNLSKSFEIKLTSKYGFDGSSGQAQFNQQLSETSDSNLFAVTMTPLLLESSDFKIWENSSPSSVRYCRPLSLEFVKESKELNVKTQKDLQQIRELEAFIILIPDGKLLSIDYKLILSAVDGKVVSHITNTSSFQCCSC